MSTSERNQAFIIVRLIEMYITILICTFEKEPLNHIFLIL